MRGWHSDFPVSFDPRGMRMNWREEHALLTFLLSPFAQHLAAFLGKTIFAAIVCTPCRTPL